MIVNPSENKLLNFLAQIFKFRQFRENYVKVRPSSWPALVYNPNFDGICIILHIMPRRRRFSKTPRFSEFYKRKLKMNTEEKNDGWESLRLVNQERFIEADAQIHILCTFNEFNFGLSDVFSSYFKNKIKVLRDSFKLLQKPRHKGYTRFLKQLQNQNKRGRRNSFKLLHTPDTKRPRDSFKLLQKQNKGSSRFFQNYFKKRTERIPEIHSNYFKNKL